MAQSPEMAKKYLPEAQKNDESRDECEERHGVAHSVEHPEAHHELFNPQLEIHECTVA